MKKIKTAKNCFFYAVTVIAITALLFITGCDKTEENNIIEIREVMFMTQVNDIYLNANDFLGRTIKLEGIFTEDTWDNVYYCFVIRNAPGGCCGNDGRVGFEVKWPEDRSGANPENNSWVEATGVLKSYEENANRLLYLELTSLNVLNRRGEEFVTR